MHVYRIFMKLKIHMMKLLQLVLYIYSQHTQTSNCHQLFFRLVCVSVCVCIYIHTGKMGDKLEYDNVLHALETIESHVSDPSKNVKLCMSEIEEDLYDAEVDENGKETVTRNDGDSVSNIEWDKLPGNLKPTPKYK